MNQPTKHALYRFYSDDGRLLYVGITNNPSSRFTQHQQAKPWWHEVRGISVETYDTRDQALAAERRAITVERPVHNLQRPALAGRGAPRALVAPARLTWVCNECHRPVADNDGYLHVSHAEVAAVRTAWQEYKQRQEGRNVADLGSLLNMPDNSRWQTHHRACDPDPEGHDYHFDVGRARTHAALLHWTAHLMEKRWLRYTDWDELIDRMSGVGGT